VTAWEQPVDYLRWEAGQIQQALDEARHGLALCPEGHRNIYRASIQRWEERLRLKEEQIGQEMAPRPVPQNGHAHAAVPRSFGEAERTGTLYKLFDTENRKQMLYGWAY